MTSLRQMSNNTEALTVRHILLHGSKDENEQAKLYKSILEHLSIYLKKMNYEEEYLDWPYNFTN